LTSKEYFTKGIILRKITFAFLFNFAASLAAARPNYDIKK